MPFEPGNSLGGRPKGAKNKALENIAYVNEVFERRRAELDNLPIKLLAEFVARTAPKEQKLEVTNSEPINVTFRLAKPKEDIGTDIRPNSETTPSV